MSASSSTEKRSGSITKEQKQILINFIEQHHELKSGKFTSNFTVKQGQSLWVEVAKNLNAVPGARKTWQKWRKV